MSIQKFYTGRYIHICFLEPTEGVNEFCSPTCRHGNRLLWGTHTQYGSSGSLYPVWSKNISVQTMWPDRSPLKLSSCSVVLLVGSRNQRSRITNTVTVVPQSSAVCVVMVMAVALEVCLRRRSVELRDKGFM